MKKTVRDNTGIVINPNQLIYSVEHETPILQGSKDCRIEDFCKRT